MNVSFDYPITEKIYKFAKTRKLKLFIFESDESNEVNRPAILFFHGGSFVESSATPARFQKQANYFSTKGFVSICVDYRTACDDDFLPTQAVMDAKSAIRWVRGHAKELNIDPNRVVMCGASSGGFTCLNSAMIDGFDEDKDNLAISKAPNALIIYNAGIDGVEIIGRLFPELNNISTQLSPLHHIKRGLPPMILFVGTADTKTYGPDKEFCDSWKEAGNQCEFISYEGLDHGFFNYGQHDNIPFHDTNERAYNFLKSLNLT